MPTRRAFLQSAAGVAFAGPHRFARRELAHELRLLAWAHPTRGADARFDARARRWGEAHDTAVRVDRVNSTEVAMRARAEALARTGHDLVQLRAAPTAFQRDVVPLNAIVPRAAGRLAAAHGYNPRTRRWFAYPTDALPLAFVRRTDVWPNAPRTWDEVSAAAPRLRERGLPVAVGLGDEPDSNAANLSLLLAHGGRLDRLGARESVAYLRAVADLYRRGMPRAVLEFTPYSNNQVLIGGRASLIVNPRTVLEAPHRLPLAASPLPVRAVAHSVGCWIVWRFARNRELALRFLADLPLLADDGATVGAGWPGPTNGAVQELVDSFLLPRTARRVAQGKATPADAAQDAAREAAEVYRKWREARLI